MTDLEKYEQLFDENPMEGSSPLRLIIESNDVATLHSYIKKYPERVFIREAMAYYNPLFVATADDRLDVLRVLLDLADSNGVQLQLDGPWDTSLLDVACEGAQLHTVKFFALLSVAYSLRSDLCYSPDPSTGGRKIWLQDEIARSEEILCMLLDRGASVRDAVRSYKFPDVEQDEKPMSLTATALGRAVSRASYKLASRLIAEGADVHARQYGWGGHPVTAVREVTALHVASGYWNVQGIKALLDNCGEVKPADMVSMRDTAGRIPLHWAAENICFDDYYLTDDEIASQICDTLELLIQRIRKRSTSKTKMVQLPYSLL
ncbi:conserved hypothetical protein [Talaromyces stipitatus ATCC 10500]|uniref:Uncharacterized protein n=1 Tax=Talaromyces stipitatus (strain ATCC 10500 / CBS 375.48 / QM 6759 / NRRL 1006) TaxID=441959 RepID=B8MRX2_TALSN|nr:uncharacterized protein TSTA_057950 [Talaromyces stipitatus ATCC 10500]EED13306.1 conserved hypothetical protein [Talaromyces stipitatus ATCC 10500]